MGLPMPWSDGPMVESTFSCKLWQPGGPSIKRMGSYNKKKEGKPSSLVNTVGFLISMLGLGAVLLKSGGANKGEVYMKIVRSNDKPVYTTKTEFIRDNDIDVISEYIDILSDPDTKVGDKIPIYEFGDFEMMMEPSEKQEILPYYTYMVVVSETEYMANRGNT